MGTLVQDLLELGTIDQAPLERRSVELGEIAAGAVQALETRARERGMRMVLEPGTVWALGDRAALAQVARNPTGQRDQIRR